MHRQKNWRCLSASRSVLTKSEVLWMFEKWLLKAHDELLVHRYWDYYLHQHLGMMMQLSAIATIPHRSFLPPLYCSFISDAAFRRLLLVF
jgi:hypothetical protein